MIHETTITKDPKYGKENMSTIIQLGFPSNMGVFILNLPIPVKICSNFLSPSGSSSNPLTSGVEVPRAKADLKMAEIE